VDQNERLGIWFVRYKF